MNVEIRTEAVQFLEKEYINGIFVAVQPIYVAWRACQTTSRQPMMSKSQSGAENLSIGQF
jgi:hypothetical protein